MISEYKEEFKFNSFDIKIEISSNIKHSEHELEKSLHHFLTEYVKENFRVKYIIKNKFADME